MAGWAWRRHGPCQSATVCSKAAVTNLSPPMQREPACFHLSLPSRGFFILNISVCCSVLMSLALGTEFCMCRAVVLNLLSEAIPCERERNIQIWTA